VVGTIPGVKPPTPPSKLGTVGTSLWRDVTAAYQFDDRASYQALYGACAAADRAEKCVCRSIRTANASGPKRVRATTRFSSTSSQLGLSWSARSAASGSIWNPSGPARAVRQHGHDQWLARAVASSPIRASESQPTPATPGSESIGTRATRRWTSCRGTSAPSSARPHRQRRYDERSYAWLIEKGLEASEREDQTETKKKTWAQATPAARMGHPTGPTTNLAVKVARSMAANESSGAGVPRKPGNPIADVEAVTVEVRPDAGLNAVELTVTDAPGDGFSTLLSFDQTLDTTRRMIRAAARLEPPMTGGAARS
jgi:hypothetical protein